MKYFVTYCTMDQRLANPFWHACLILSCAPALDCKIEIKNAWGFYPTTISNPNSFLSQLKKSLGFNFDLQDNFGILKNEEMRYLDLGYGLRGVTFEINKHQFNDLQKRCKEIMVNQELAINEARQNLLLLGNEPDSIKIFEEEKRRAHAEDRQSRLNRFDFRITLSDTGWSLNNSYTCKTIAVELLAAIGIPQVHLDEITLQNNSIALPKYSGDMEEIFFHSVGPRHEFQSKRTNSITFFRQWEDKEDKLYWSLPPQNIASTNPDNTLQYDNHEYALPVKWAQAAKKFLSRLQQIESVVVNAKIDDQDESIRKKLSRSISDLYEKFSVLNAHSQTNDLRDNLYEANYFLNRMYFAMNENWNNDAVIETIAAKFDRETQLKICKILDRPLTRSANDEYLEWKPQFLLTI